MSISSISSASPTYQYTPPVTTDASASPVVASTDPGLAQEVGALTTTGGIVATLGAASTATQTYDAAGLYNSIAQAGTSTTTPVAVPAAGTNTQVSAQQSLDSSIVGSLPSSSVESGLYSGAGVLQSASSNSAALTSNWASALQANPSLSKVVAADSYAQGIVGTLSVRA
ncbi:MAG: hypothetical protein ACHP7O_12715 [Burkholderiales bacterium]